MVGDIIRNLLHTSDKFLSEDEDISLRKIDAVFNLVRRVTEIQRYGDGAGFEYSEIDRQPVKAVHKKDGNLVALYDTAGNQKIRDTVCFFIKDAPRDLCTIRNLAQRLDQFVLFPGGEFGHFDLGIQFDERYVIGIFPGVFFQKISDKHGRQSPLYSFQNSKIYYTLTS